MKQYWKAAAPEPVYGQRQCRVERVLGDQRSDTPDQSAARSTTLGHLLGKGVPKGKGGSRRTAQRTKERGESKGGAGNPGPVYGQKDQAQHPRETKSQKRRGRRGREEAAQRRTETNRGGKGAGAKDTVKGDAPPTDVRRKT